MVFVLKLDKAEVVKGKKYERISIILMNRALDPSISRNDENYFSVQSEHEIWPIACFEVLKETNEIFKWVFDQVPLKALITTQEAGQ